MLFERFCAPAFGPLPALFDDTLADRMRPYRRFRHVARHAYGFDLNWSQMKSGAEGIEPVFERFRERVVAYLERLA